MVVANPGINHRITPLQLMVVGVVGGHLAHKMVADDQVDQEEHGTDQVVDLEMGMEDQMDPVADSSMDQEFTLAIKMVDLVGTLLVNSGLIFPIKNQRLILALV